MTTAGPNYAGTAANSGAGTAWATPSNATGSPNGTTSDCDIAAGQTTKMLLLTNFGFSVPGAATITGVRAILKSTTVGGSNLGFGPASVNVQIRNAGAGVGAAKSTTMNTDPAADLTLGNSSDLWSGTLTPAVVNSSTFGIGVTGSTSSDESNLQIDAASIEVFYTTPSSGPAPQSQTIGLGGMGIGL